VLEDPGSKFERHRGRGVVVDSALLVVYVVGLCEDINGVPLLQTYKHTKNDYDRQDYEFLLGFLEQFRTHVVTPHILTEVSNMLGQLREPARAQCRSVMSATISELEERCIAAAQIASDEAFLEYGITDAGIRRIGTAPYLVLTADRPLAGHLNKIGVDALLFEDARYAL
jgi:hypothetical protein